MGLLVYSSYNELTCTDVCCMLFTVNYDVQLIGILMKYDYGFLDQR